MCDQCGIHVITTLNMKIVTSNCAPRVQGKPQGKSMVAPTIKSLYYGEIAIFRNSASNGMRSFESWFIDRMHLAFSPFILNSDVLKSSRIKEFSWYYSWILSPWLKKILTFEVLKSARMKEFNSFTMVEENFEFWSSEISQNERI